MTQVVDASVVVAALVESGELGAWAAAQLVSTDLIAPHLLPAEVVSGLRRMVAAEQISGGLATAALESLDAVSLELYPFLPFRSRAWELRNNLSAYDAWYVAVAEASDAPLATLDRRLARAHGPRCDFLTPA